MWVFLRNLRGNTTFFCWFMAPLNIVNDLDDFPRYPFLWLFRNSHGSDQQQLISRIHVPIITIAFPKLCGVYGPDKHPTSITNICSLRMIAGS